MIKGFLAKSWYVLASTFPSSNRSQPPITQQDTGHSRIQKTLQALRTMVLTLWEARNSALHANLETDTNRLKTTLDSEITWLHAQRLSLSVMDQHYCDVSLSKILRSQPSYKRRWMARVKKARTQYHLECQSQPRITSFFHRHTLTEHIRHKSQHTHLHHTRASTIDACRLSRISHTSSTQRLLTEFLQERASNSINSVAISQPQSPPPP